MGGSLQWCLWAEGAKAASAGAPTPTPTQARPEGPVKVNAPRIRTSAADILTPSPTPIKPMTSIVGPVRTAPVPARTPWLRQTSPAAKDILGAAAAIGKERDTHRPPRTLFGLGSAAAATLSSPALSSSIATPVLSSTASLARPPLNPASALPPANRNTPAQSSSPPPPQPQPLPSPAAAGQRPPRVNGGGFKAELAFGHAKAARFDKVVSGPGIVIGISPFLTVRGRDVPRGIYSLSVFRWMADEFELVVLVQSSLFPDTNPIPSIVYPAFLPLLRVYRPNLSCFLFKVFGRPLIIIYRYQ